MTEDEQIFGADRWVYCNQHLRPHLTGWCTVSPQNKVALAANNEVDAYELCRRWRFVLYRSTGDATK